VNTTSWSHGNCKNQTFKHENKSFLQTYVKCNGWENHSTTHGKSANSTHDFMKGTKVIKKWAHGGWNNQTINTAHWRNESNSTDTLHIHHWLRKSDNCKNATSSLKLGGHSQNSTGSGQGTTAQSGFTSVNGHRWQPGVHWFNSSMKCRNWVNHS
jgi:hypothetical protein